MTLRTMNKSNRMSKLLVVGMMLAFCLCSTVMPCFALGGGAGVSAVMTYVMDILTTAAKYVGAIISIWGIFQIILAMRREDSEAISKQIMTVIVGAVLIGFGFGATELLNAIMAG